MMIFVVGENTNNGSEKSYYYTAPTPAPPKAGSYFTQTHEHARGL